MSHESKVNRCNKGESLLIALNDYVVVDLETTGLSPFDEEIIEFAAARVVNGSVIETFSTLANPRRQISKKITVITGITNEMLNDAPDVSDALDGFLEFVGDSVIVGHNIGFDINFIYDSCMRHGKCCFTNDFIDTLRISRRCVEHLPDHKLDTISKYYGIPNDNAHRALSDVLCTYKVYEVFKNFYYNDEFHGESHAFGSYDPTSIHKSVVAMIGEGDTFIDLSINKTNVVLNFFDLKAFTIRVNSRSAVIFTDYACAKKYVELIPGAFIYKNDYFFFPIATKEENVDAVQQMLRDVYHEAFENAPVERFGCCNDFERCSDALACLHKDSKRHVGCVYRRNLEAGRIFYGKNKNC